MGQGCVEDGFSKNLQVDGDRAGTRTQTPCFPEWRSVVGENWI